MASLLLTLTVFYYLANINALPVRYVESNNEVLGSLPGKEFDVPELHNRNRGKRSTYISTAGSNDNSGCANGAKYIRVTEPTCVVKKTVYNVEVKKCLILHSYVPGMPDGEKGSNYQAHKDFLYKFYAAVNITRIRACP